MKTLILMCLAVLPGLVNAQPLEAKILDDGGSGPYRAVATTEPSLAGYVVYRPQNLSVAAHADSGDYYQVIDTGRIASAWQSCGGAQLLATAFEPRFSTYLMFNSGIGDMHMAAASRASLTNLHGPVIYLVGGDTGVATDNAKLDYQRIEHVPVVFANHLTTGHSGTFEQPYGGSFAALALKWLDWQLKGESREGNVFTQPEPADFPAWRLMYKNFPDRDT